jgi:hypothetical protein
VTEVGAERTLRVARREKNSEIFPESRLLRQPGGFEGSPSGLTLVP